MTTRLTRRWLLYLPQQSRPTLTKKDRSNELGSALIVKTKSDRRASNTTLRSVNIFEDGVVAGASVSRSYSLKSDISRQQEFFLLKNPLRLIKIRNSFSLMIQSAYLQWSPHLLLNQIPRFKAQTY